MQQQADLTSWLAGLEIFHFNSRVVEQIGRMCFKTN